MISAPKLLPIIKSLKQRCEVPRGTRQREGKRERERKRRENAIELERTLGSRQARIQGVNDAIFPFSFPL
ncbi:unnamed protein product [Prunus brigantina]